MWGRLGLFGLAFAASAAVPAFAAPPKSATGRPASVANISIFPTSICLNSRRSTRQLVVTFGNSDNSIDLTGSAAYSSTNPAVVSVNRGVVRAVKAGIAAVIVSAGGKILRVPVNVTDAEQSDPISFKFETLPLLTKQGCSAGSCHGSPHGKGGFSLSLFGYDPRIDRISLTRDGFNRRLNMIEPADSLLLKIVCCSRSRSWSFPTAADGD
jgi:hypothetical protein